MVWVRASLSRLPCWRVEVSSESEVRVTVVSFVKERGGEKRQPEQGARLEEARVG